MLRALLLVLVVHCAASAWAQTAAQASGDLSRGPALLPGSVAFANEPTALVYNPAGLGRVGRLSGIFIHERSNARALDSDGLYLGSSLGLFGLGTGFEWVRPTDSSPGRARSLLGLSLGPEVLAVGMALGWHFGTPTDGLLALDVGVQSRPARWLALGALARNLNAPVKVSNGVELTREWGLGIGLRPFRERVTLGVDWLARERAPIGESRLQYTASATLVSGLTLSAGVSHGFDRAAPLAIQGSLAIDLDNVGYAQGVAVVNEAANFQFAARLSLDRYPTILPSKKIAVVSIDDLTSSPTTPLGTLMGLPAEDRFLRLLRFFHRAARDPDLAGVILKLEGAGVGFARADELRSAVLRLRGAGKKVYAYLLSVDDPEYLVASACDLIAAPPEAMFMVDGLRASVTFLGGALEKLGVKVDVARVGAYKNAPDQLTRTSMSPEQREAVNALLDTTARTLEQRVLEQRKALSAETRRAAIDEGLRSVRRAKALGEIDAILDPQGLEERLKTDLPGARIDPDYLPDDTRDDRWRPAPAIAIVPVLGAIEGGKNQDRPVAGLVAGAESFIEALSRAADDSSVAAIVVRVDSGGGDGLASYLMYKAVLEAKKKKPVLVSMGDVAASGGYYLAAGADEIWASPTTVTGSIGVFFLKPGLKPLAERFGVTREVITRGARTGITDFFEPWSEEQQQVAQRWVDDFYDTFISEVASARRLSKAQVDAVARGRVWSGESAKERGLVDHLGGLLDTIAAARRRANLPDQAEVRLVIAKPGSSLLTSLVTATGVSLPDPSGPWAALPALESLLRTLGPDAWVLGRPGVQARAEHTISLR